MGATEALKRLLRERGIPFVEDGRGLTVEARDPSGFDVSIEEGGGEIMVYFEGWHEHFTSEEEAVKCVLFGLSPDCRIRVTERGGTPHKWVLESRQDGAWVPVGTTALIFFPFWRSATTKYLRNGGRE